MYIKLSIIIHNAWDLDISQLFLIKAAKQLCVYFALYFITLRLHDICLLPGWWSTCNAKQSLDCLQIVNIKVEEMIWWNQEKRDEESLENKKLRIWHH